MKDAAVDWQSRAVAGLGQLRAEFVPAMELLYLDGLAVHLLGPDSPVPPYTVEHGSAIVSMLLRAVRDAPLVELDLEPEPAAAAAREAIASGAERFVSRRGQGVQRLANRLLGAAVGELEQHQEAPESQVRSLFYYGLLAIASGPENQTNAEVSDAVLAAFSTWDQRIGEGFVPPWRVVSNGQR